MRKHPVFAFIVLFGAIAAIPLAAQSATPTAALPTAEARMVTRTFNPGDKIFSISLGVNQPIFNINPNNMKLKNPKLYLGGAAELEWDFFVLPGLALGGQIGGIFNNTPAQRTLFLVPLSFKTSYFFGIQPWEFPIGLGIGPCIDTVSDSTHVDLFLKPQGGVFYRVNAVWSFGVNVSYLFIPQIYSSHPDQNRIANMVEFSIAGLYHF